MAEKILIMGESGRGKSTSMRNLDPKTTVVIRVLKKPLPFKGWKAGYKLYDKESGTGNMFDLSSAANIVKCIRYVDMEMKHIKTVVVDDGGTVMSLELFDKVDEKGYEKFTKVALNMKNVLMCPDQLRDDLMVAYMFHVEETSFNGLNKVKAKTAGKMLDNALGVESLFTVVLQAEIIKRGKDEVDYVFVTQSDGTNTVKSPIGMFPDKHIPNDLQYVIERIEEYNNG